MLLKAKEGEEAVRNKRKADQERKRFEEAEAYRLKLEAEDAAELAKKEKIEDDLRQTLTKEHQEEMARKEAERLQVEAKLQEFMSEHDKL